MTTERWWHVFTGHSGGAWVSITLGGSPEHPEALIARAGPTMEITLLEEQRPCTLHYARSFLYEPSEEQVEELRLAAKGVAAD